MCIYMWHCMAHGEVQRAEPLMWNIKQAILGCFSLYFVKPRHDTPSNVSHSKYIMTSYALLKPKA